MRFPDIEEVVAVAAATLRRFPATLLAALAACAAAFILVDYSGPDDPLVRLLLASILGIALMFSIESGAERDGRVRWRLPATGIAAIVLGAFWVLSEDWSETQRFERFGQLLLAFHLLAAFAAFIGFDEENGFWQFNKALFLRFWTA
ncbi:MAG: hypothetical protein HKN91_04230, partial [Acidimicrobiia bacterium]|nr:hypothetical protein [Acidimicrobiia bacterium]